MTPRRVRRAAVMVALAATGALLAGGCADDEGPSRDAMIDQAVEVADLDEATATCLVDGLLDEFGADRVEEMVTSNQDVEDYSEDELAALTEVGNACFDTEALPDDPGIDLDEVPPTTG